MKSLKNMPESLETMTDSVPLWFSPTLLWKFLINMLMFDLCFDKHKHAFSFVEKCHMTSWPCP